MHSITLNNGVRMPRLGLGVARIPDAQAAEVVTQAIELGYRSIDTATDYGNEHGVGTAVRDAGVPRDELFVTTKLWNADHGYRRTLCAFDRSLDRLGLDYVDLYLIHWPVPRQGRFIEAWRAMEDLLDGGRVRAIGVSNFEPHHLEALMRASSVVPAVNQIELHPLLQQRTLREVHRRHAIVTEAWSPLANARLLDHPVLTAIAANRGVTAAQVALRWHLDQGHVVIPKTVAPSRLRENLEALALEPLARDELASMTALDDGTRIGPHPDVFDDGAVL